MFKSKRLRYACIAVAIMTAVSISLQLYLMWRLPNRPHNPFRKARAESAAYGAVKKFLKVCHDNDVSAFVIDPTVLEIVVHDSAVAKPCRFFCFNRTYTFAVTASTWLDKEALVLRELQRASFGLATVDGADPRLADVDSRSSMHHLLSSGDGSRIHVVVFYERPGEFWWHAAAAVWKDPLLLPLQQELPFTAHEGAFDVMEIPKIPMDGLEVGAPMYPHHFLSAIGASRFLECNRTRAALFQQKYGSSIVENLHFRSQAKRVLELAKTRLDSLGVPFWLSSGTCLGWFRQCDLIPYSKDVDVGIFIKDYNHKMISYFKESGVPLHHVLGKEDDSYQLSFNTGDIRLDVFFFYEESDHIWNGGTQAKSGRKFKYVFPKFTLCWTEFLEMKVRVPCQTEAYVEANYGKNWFDPVKEWDWKKSPSNVREVGRWPKDEMDIVVQLFNEKGKRIFIEWTDNTSVDTNQT